MLRLGSVKSGKTAFSRLAVALALHHLCIVLNIKNGTPTGMSGHRKFKR